MPPRLGFQQKRGVVFEWNRGFVKGLRKAHYTRAYYKYRLSGALIFSSLKRCVSEISLTYERGREDAKVYKPFGWVRIYVGPLLLK